jgi:AraC-like DNA-binding protein
MTHSPEWAAWRRIIIRCGNQSSPSYEHYGAKGIRVCDRWRTSFEAFFADMGQMPSDRRTIDRIDNLSGYEPGNCRWASATEQNRNKTSNVRLTHDGRTMTVAEWAREIGMSQSGLHDRLKKMTTQEALTMSDQRGQRRWRAVA